MRDQAELAQLAAKINILRNALGKPPLTQDQANQMIQKLDTIKDLKELPEYLAKFQRK